MPQPDHIVFDWDANAPPAELGGGVRVPSEFSAQLMRRS